MPGSPPYDALLVPDAAIGTEQVRKFVYVVDAENTVRAEISSTLGSLQGPLRVVKAGLGGRRPVIVNGLMRARPGVKVTPMPEGTRPPASARCAWAEEVRRRAR